ncbi:MAG: type IX secretion system sortase PorU [Bacteroidales bacterium]|jgi:hypothetical protein|nr:type IX secretion system sortase PorU [Bacteroidales bacterium]
MKHYIFFIISIVTFCNLCAQSITYTDSSVLANGSWYAVTISQSGIYKLTAEDFRRLGVPNDSIDFQNITIWGQGGLPISQINADCNESDLKENSIYVNTQGNPYVLFYAEGNTKWNYDKSNNFYSFETHPYSDNATYFICFDPSKGEKKRIASTVQLTGNSDYQVSYVRDVYLHNRDLINPRGEGRTFYGETITHTTNELKIPVNLQNFVQGSTARIKIKIGSTRNDSEKIFTYKFNNYVLGSNYLGKNDNFGDAPEFIESTPPLNSAIDTVSIEYTSNSTRDKAYLDYILINYDKNLQFNSSPLFFNAVVGLEENKIADYIISNTRQDMKVWNVTNPTNVTEMSTNFQNNQTTLKLNTQTFQKFIAFAGSNFPTPALKGKIENQNLHGLSHVDFIIITAPEFISQADTLAKLHRINDSINVAVVTTQQVYNEFSSGTKDFLAFKEFLRMMYKKYLPEGKQPKNVLLFGDGTYDNKNILKFNNNFIPTYQSASTGVCADMYIAFLDDNATGNVLIDKMRVGVGRFTVNDTYEANVIVDKCKRYLLKEDLRESGYINDWKNYFTLTCDDDDQGETYFVTTSEDTYYSLRNVFPTINAHKFYSDAYKQFSSSSGPTYPDATKAINNRMSKGSLTFNYVGHGSEDHLSSERLITIGDITSWTNYNQPTLFITSTCEFTKFDMVDKASGGEIAFLSSNGGAIAVISSTRKISSRSDVNCALHRNFVEKQTNGKALTLGEAFVKCQNQLTPQISNDFVLVGDPALRLNIPEYNVYTKTINGKNVEDTLIAAKDTVKALSQMHITGEIRDNAGNTVTSFNGKILITLFDKVKTYYTLNNEGHDVLKTFEQQKNILYKGITEVINGEFTHSFTVPKDISYDYGRGKLSYYAKTDSVDASGYNDWFMVGGIDDSIASIIETMNTDTTYTIIKLYMNDTNFRDKGITDQNPDLFAIIEDSIAINVVGSGLGHDIMARLDNAANTFVLNDYYEQDTLNPNKGYIRFPFYDLQDGEHTLTLKVWNIFNFSSEKTITFYVNNGNEPLYTNLKNYPNPFETSTTIVIEHNQSGKIKEATIYIFDLSGRIVRKIPATPYISNYTIGPLVWDGTDEGGKRLGSGIYVYKIVMETTEGEVHSAGNKMIIFNRKK